MYKNMKTENDIAMKLSGLLLIAATKTFTKHLLFFQDVLLVNDVRYGITKEVVSGQ